jgi:putative membrane protein
VSDRNAESSEPVVKPMAAAARPTLWGALRGAIASWWGTDGARGRKATSDELAADRTDMAATRSLMAADRTLMAWVRTSLSLNSFGFTIYKVLQGFTEAGTNLPHGQTPWSVGLVLTGLGTLAMVMGTVEYARAIRDLRRYIDANLARPAFIMALVMSVLGLILFFSILSKL